MSPPSIVIGRAVAKDSNTHISSEIVNREAIAMLFLANTDLEDQLAEWITCTLIIHFIVKSLQKVPKF